MLDFPRWKIASIIGVLLIGILLAVPSLMPESTAKQLGLGFAPRISLGLDLAGGSHILLEADTADVAKTRLSNMEDTVRAAMRKNTPAPIAIGDISTANNALSFFVRDPSQIDAAVDTARNLTQPVGTSGTRDWTVQVVDSTRIVMTQTQGGINQFIDQAMAGAVDIVRKRIDALGTKEPTIARQGSDRILVEVPGVQDPTALKALIGKTAKLEFKLVDMAPDKAAIAAGRAPIGEQILFTAQGQPVVVYRQAILTGSDLKSARQDYDQSGQPAVSISFNPKGAKAFAETTQANVNKQFAMILDGQVLSAPVIQVPILDGNAIINGGNFTTQSAQALAISLQSGSLPIALKTVEERTVLASLGQDSIHAGVIASAIAVGLVVVFMFVTYGRFGLYANLAVIINVLVILGGMALLTATLTLPGIAGFVLTIGTAVDANVLINERIREERRRGRNVVQAVELGYKEASRTIFEANITHAISGMIMLLLGSGPVKGFAVVLLLGIVTSVFTAVTFTRMLVAIWIRRQRPQTMNI
ncbi:protein translocase subunit SecD [Sphingomonas sp. CGMCC 1.13654]|uniref:Protein translocase subunit SecD n=1 Tax=Sphingomonas chungangi TaxID=2683589 RepID=A0A838L8N9_9SPHN|nr:protein translocase subunit SecD [Sphingomonas chungangi]MBA2934909.1 protein translocase subunit SecD [Sphingomonas chungangi]MVW58220.1 protein translocase subunit SecD [Sphingomonas chungangi]